jgi:DNA-binding NarL/FixJ family response regulator
MNAATMTVAEMSSESNPPGTTGEQSRPDTTSVGMCMRAKILIADDHEVVRQGVRSIIEKARPEWEICGEAGNGKEAIQAVKTLKPDVAILDITMPVMSGLLAASHISKLDCPCAVLIFTMHESDMLIPHIREVGGKGYVQKSRASHDLVLAIDCLLAGETFFHPQEKERGNPPASGAAPSASPS